MAMEEQENKFEKNLERRITRRRAIQAGGLVVLGLAFSKPTINTIFPKPAFAAYPTPTPTSPPPPPPGIPSIMWEDPPGDDLVFADTARTGGVVKEPAFLCDASTPAAATYSASVEFSEIISGAYFVGLSIESNPVAVGETFTVGPFDDPGECIKVVFQVELTSQPEIIEDDGEITEVKETKLRFVATAPDGPAVSLTLNYV